MRLIDELNDARLLALANERMSHYDSSTVIAADKVYKELGIASEDLEGFNEVEIE